MNKTLVLTVALLSCGAAAYAADEQPTLEQMEQVMPLDPEMNIADEALAQEEIKKDVETPKTTKDLTENPATPTTDAVQ